MNELFGYDSGIHYHAQILDAFKNGDADAAHDIMYEHLDAAMKSCESDSYRTACFPWERAVIWKMTMFYILTCMMSYK